MFAKYSEVTPDNGSVLMLLDCGCGTCADQGTVRI
jgi:hypothetical protein